MTRAALLLALPLLLAASSPALARSPDYTETTQPYFAALKRTCPAKRLEWLAPGALSDDVQSFPQSLPPGLRRRLDQATRTALRRCRGRDGASCENGVSIAALERLRLTRRFAARVCTVHLTCRAQSDCD